MTGRLFHRTTEVIPRRPWKAKSTFASRPIKMSIKKGTRRVRTRYEKVLLAFISFVQCPGRPVIPVPEQKRLGACTPNLFLFVGHKWIHVDWFRHRIAKPSLKSRDPIAFCRGDCVAVVRQGPFRTYQEGADPPKFNLVSFGSAVKKTYTAHV